MLSKARFLVKRKNPKQISKTAKSTLTTTTITTEPTAALSSTLTRTKTNKRAATKKPSTTASITAATTTAIPSKITSTTLTAATTATTKFRLKNAPNSCYCCCWQFLLCCYCYLFICIVLPQYGIQAEISTAADISVGLGGVGGLVANAGTTGINDNGVGVGYGISAGFSTLLNNFEAAAHCSSRKFNNMAKTIDDVEDLELDVPVNIAFDNRQRKR